MNISNGITTLTPLNLAEYTASRRSRNGIVPILGSHVPAVTLATAALRSGRLRFLVASAAVAAQWEQLLAGGTKLTLTQPDHALQGMTFVVEGAVELELVPDRTATRRWYVTCGYQEIPA